MGVGINEMGQMNFEPDKDFEQKPPSKELSEYLKKKLRDRGILKDDSNKDDLVSFFSNLIYIVLRNKNLDLKLNNSILLCKFKMEFLNFFYLGG